MSVWPWPFLTWIISNCSMIHTDIILGDLILVEIAQRLRRSLRQDDLLARIGGDEFLLLLEGVPVHGAKEAVAP